MDEYFADPDLVAAGEAAEQNVLYEDWFEESNELAVSHAYGPLRQRLLDADENDSARIGRLSGDYVRAGRELSQERVMEAGYRLAAILNDIYR